MPKRALAPGPYAGLSPKREPAPDPGFGIYVHWPFCLAKCPYCDFNSHVRATIDQARWRAALLQDLDHWAERTSDRTVTSVFFGGGTPSLMDPATPGALLDRIARRWSVDESIEVTLEANPTSAEAERLAGFAAAGVNRISLGVQALDDRVLQFLGRRHSVADALAAIDLARRHVARVSFDLIYARPGQSPEAWCRELRQALAERPEHLSVYQLTIEPNTPFHAAWRRGDLEPPDEATQAVLYEVTQETLSAAGLPAYEISNHASDDAACRHNLTYWRYGDYLGIGPGAHGRVRFPEGRFATRAHRAPEVWLQRVQGRGEAPTELREITDAQRLAEMTMMGLRLREGIHRAAFRREFGVEPESLFARSRLRSLEQAGYVVLDETALQATDAGRQRLDAVLSYLLE